MTSKVKQKVEKGVSSSPERFRMSEMGSLGLKVFNGVSAEETKRELSFPNNLNTYKEMTYHSCVNAALSLYENQCLKATWKYNPRDDATEQEKQQCKYINEMMHDMQHSWSNLIKDALTFNIYGFAPVEKVFYRRYRSNGSQYNDGIIGWRKLPLRSQETIRIHTVNQGGDIKYIEQLISGLTDTYNLLNTKDIRNIENPKMPREKFILFKTGRHRGDPYGKSPLRDVYLAWKFITVLEELEAIGVAKDLNGLPVLTLPVELLSSEASPDQKAQREYFENSMRNLQNNQQGCVVLPGVYDPDTRQAMYKLELLSVDGKKSFDLNKIKEYYKNQIMTSLGTDILTMGQTQVGSFALGSLKNSLTGSFVEAMLSNIAETIDRDLIRHTYELNGWDVSRRGVLDFDNVAEVDLESVSKYWYRLASTGLVEKDREVLNAIRVAGGVDPLPDDLPPQQELISPDTSRAGDGFKTAGEGTSTEVTGTDSSSLNTENAG